MFEKYGACQMKREKQFEIKIQFLLKKRDEERENF